MCLGVPGRVERITREEDLVRLGEVSFAGVVKEINLTCVPEAVPGDWVMVHVGLAIARVDEAAALATLEVLVPYSDPGARQPDPP